MNYYKRHLGDYAKKCGHLSPLEHGVYNLLMDAYYDRERGPTKQESVRIARARTADELAAVDSVLDQFFDLGEDGLYTQARIEEELAVFRARQETNRELGAKGGKAKAKRTASESLENGLANAKPSHKPLTITNSEKKEQPPAASFVVPDWINQEVWQGFAEMRKKKRAPLTVRACAMVITELIKLRDKGHEPNEVLDQSTRNSWTDVYAINEKGHADPARINKSKTMQGISALEGMKHAPRNNDAGAVVQRLDFERPAKVAVPGS